MTAVINQSENTSWISYVMSAAGSKAQEIATAADYFAGRAAVWIKHSSNVTARITRSPDALKNTISGTIALINASHLFNSIIVSKKVLDTASVIGEFIGATKIIQSLDYFCNGKYLKDVRNSKHFTVAAEACILCCRIADTLVWSAKNKLIDLGSIATKTASVTVFGRAIVVSAMTPVLVIAIAGLINYAIEDMKELFAGRNVTYRVIDLVNQVVTVALLSCFVVGGVAPLAIAALEVATAGTAVLSFFWDPEVA
jgi:hypothetical protein